MKDYYTPAQFGNIAIKDGESYVIRGDNGDEIVNAEYFHNVVGELLGITNDIVSIDSNKRVMIDLTRVVIPEPEVIETVREPLMRCRLHPVEFLLEITEALDAKLDCEYYLRIPHVVSIRTSFGEFMRVLKFHRASWDSFMVVRTEYDLYLRYEIEVEVTTN